MQATYKDYLEYTVYRCRVNVILYWKRPKLFLAVVTLGTRKTTMEVGIVQLRGGWSQIDANKIVSVDLFQILYIPLRPPPSE
jgi:hypothetical protein